MKYGINTEFKYKDGTITFSTSGLINSGIDLEKLSIDEYYILIKITYSNSDIKYYSLQNSTPYNKTEYYTITKNNLNNKIEIFFDTYNAQNYMKIIVKKATCLPENVYDIAIDPGHGGLDSGAKSNGYTEAEIALNCGIILKNKLENLGLKVFISRNGTESKKEDTANNMYDEKGRINILNESHAKIIISLHLNSSSYKLDTGGVEVYCPNNCNLEFAKLLAKNIVTKTNSYYSELSTYKKADGVYVQNFTNADILTFKNKALKNNYEPYNITTSTPYLYLIRETGGINTNAFVDGRNSSYGINKYYNSNIGIETYLIELGYMVVHKDLTNILNNSENYMEAIVDSIYQFYIREENT